MKSAHLSVKFFIPKPGPGLIDRPRLVRRFSSGLDRPLTLISAPAGFGKSTLVSSWIRHQAGEEAGRRFDVMAWLSLDGNDNNPAQFWSYTAAALQNGPAEGHFSHTLELLQADPPPPVQPVLDGLINEMTGSGLSFLLVFDDYHAIQSVEIHEQMTYLLDHQPPDLRLVISTRVDPPLPVSRLRARGQLSEFRSTDLRFDPGEVSGFLREMLGLDLTGEELQTIENSTEGWIAGLQMAALALQALVAGQADGDEPGLHEKVRQFISTFSGKHVFILDYLADEVFNRQPVPVQEFLLKTALLERMNASLCAALLQPADEKQEEAPALLAQGMLDYLVRSNLFLIRLDNESEWFRYHHLFADLLRARLQQTWPERVPALHLRASKWFERNGNIDEAVRHALAAQEWNWAAGLIEVHVAAYLQNGQLASVLKWIEAVPKSMLRRRPNLSMQVAWALTHAGQYQRVPALLDEIETALRAWDQQNRAAPGEDAVFLSEAEALRVRAISTILRAFGMIMTAQPQQALDLARGALETLSGLQPRELAWLNWMMGYSYRGMGRLELAIHHFDLAVRINQQGGEVWEDLSTDLGIAYRLSGKLASAASVFSDSLRQAEELGLRNKGNLSRVEAFYSAVLLEQNRLAEALEHAHKGVYYLQWWPSYNHITTAYMFLGLALLGAGRLDEAAQVIQKADQEQHKGLVMPTVRSQVEYASVRLWLARGDWDLLERWLAGQETQAPTFGDESASFNEAQEIHLVSLARVWLGKGRKEGSPDWFEKAVHLLNRLESSAGRSGRVNHQVEICLLQAVALHELKILAPGESADALACLTRSLALGLPEGYRRVYLHEGRPCAELLRDWLRAQPVQGLNPRQVKDLLDHFEAEPVRTAEDLVEPLTEREAEVLQLLALGLSNKEIAGRLVISEGTAKTHVHNLIGKLGAQSRIHVLARAKELHLL